MWTCLWTCHFGGPVLDQEADRAGDPRRLAVPTRNTDRRRFRKPGRLKVERLPRRPDPLEDGKKEFLGPGKTGFSSQNAQWFAQGSDVFHRAFKTRPEPSTRSEPLFLPNRSEVKFSMRSTPRRRREEKTQWNIGENSVHPTWTLTTTMTLMCFDVQAVFGRHRLFRHGTCAVTWIPRAQTKPFLEPPIASGAGTEAQPRTGREGVEREPGPIRLNRSVRAEPGTELPQSLDTHPFASRRVRLNDDPPAFALFAPSTVDGSSALWVRRSKQHRRGTDTDVAGFACFAGRCPGASPKREGCDTPVNGQRDTRFTGVCPCLEGSGLDDLSWSAQTPVFG